VSLMALTTFWLMLAVTQSVEASEPAIGAVAPAFSNRGADAGFTEGEVDRPRVVQPLVSVHAWPL
jgi:hypothetical protein